MLFDLFRSPALGLATVVAAAGAGGSSVSEENLLLNGSFESGFEGWTSSGPVSLSQQGFAGSRSVRIEPGPGLTGELRQTVEGLVPRGRYTLAARVRTNDRLNPPVLGVRDGAQIDKALGWIAVGEEGRWLERRFEVHVDEGADSLEVYLRGWQAESGSVIEFDSIRLWEGRQPAPQPDPGEAPWAVAPLVEVAPSPGDPLLRDGDFGDPTGGGWALGLNATIETTGSGNALRLRSTEDTSRATQPITAALPPHGQWTVSVETRVDPGVVASLYFTGSGDTVASRSFDHTEWRRIELPVESGTEWVRDGRLTLENWKEQPGSAWYRDLRFTAVGGEWRPTLDSPPTPALEVFHDDFSSGTLDPGRWLVSSKAWGGDNGGVAPQNVTLVEDFDEGRPIIALRLEAHGDHYDGPLVHNGRRTRVGAAIATRDYYASGRYEVRARIAPEYGTCTAFWPFHYIDHQMGEPEYWHEPNPRRNTEIDWEFPTDLAGADTGNFSFTKARTNSWGGQFGGEGGEHKGRKLLRDEDGALLDLATEALDGRYHTFTIEWRSGSDLGDESITRSEVGSVRWLIDGRLVDELQDVPFGQGNVPFRAARFWLGTWFPAAGYGDRVGWTGDPEFGITAAHVAWVRITPFGNARDRWVDETVPNLAWADPGDYPEPIEPLPPLAGDLDRDGVVDGRDLAILLQAWGAEDPVGDLDESGVVDGADLAILLQDWSG